LALTPGTRLGVYEVTAQIGEGGMGQVYRATDTRLKRQVAIKILPPSLAADHHRLARFQREAEVLASLNHPNIAAIYGVEEGGGMTALVMELVEGDDLSQRIARGAIPPDEALPIAKQIADALEAAHEQGIIHRDLKPANIKVRSDGTVKVLDFGLAKAMEPAGAMPAGASMSPTITTPAMTQAGMILGTAAYMSPEQARGRIVDRRADIWAFGAVLFEMVTGTRAFNGDDVQDTFIAIMRDEPEWARLPATLSPAIGTYLKRCLQKDLKQRVQAIGDVRLALEGAFETAGPQAAGPATRPTSARALRWAALAGVFLVGATAAAMIAWVTRPVSVPPGTTRTLVSVAPTGQSLGAEPPEQRVGGRPSRTAVALSPDGKTLVFGAIWGGDEQLYSRAMDQLSATPISGTSGGSSPFFSPDGRWVGFWAEGELRKVPLAGGPAVTLCRTAPLFGASWGTDGTIVFAAGRNGGLSRVSAAGGMPETLTTVQPGEYSHRLPHVLPGGRAVIFTIAKAPARWNDAQVVVRSLETGKQTVLIEGGADGRYVPTGHLVYVRLGTLMAAPFDPVRLAITGGAIGLLDGVMQSANNTAFNFMLDTGAAQLTVSDTGALVYVTGGVLPEARRSLAWVDRRGASQELPAPPRPYFAPRLSADGQHVAVFLMQSPRDVWSFDIARGTLSAVTVDGRSSYGIFSPDRKRMVFRSTSAGGGEDNLFWKAADGSGAAERLTTSTRSQTPASWSPDRTTLAFVEEANPVGQFDIWVVSIADRKVRAVIQTSANETSPEFSPDGRWLAYVSNQSGRNEVYVQPYPGPGERHLISTNGGEQPAWGGNGRELFYVQAGEPGRQLMKLVSVRIGTSPTFLAGTPETLFESVNLASAWGRAYDVAPDGQRFLMALNKEQPTNPAPTQMIFVQNWFDELKRLVPTN
jgi:serine/threonine-protein kinase